jgi:sialic acid synthase SpsE
MVREVRDVEKIMGDAKFEPDTTLRRSLYYNQNIKKGTIIKKEHLKTARPNLGLSPLRIDEILGTKCKGVKENAPVRL